MIEKIRELLSHFNSITSNAILSRKVVAQGLMDFFHSFDLTIMVLRVVELSSGG